jgi:arylformamidase
VPDHLEIIVGWERDAALYRAERSDRSELGLRYGKHPRQIIDLFHPDAPDPARPLVLFIHGGYWRTFDPTFFSHFAAGLNRRGYTVALPGYRLCPEVTVADIIDDMRAAVLHLHRRFRSPLVASGYSAGGHLAATLVATDWAALGAPSALLRRGLSISGVFDLTPLVGVSMNNDLRLDAAGARAVSPLFWEVPAGVSFESWVGGAESEEFLRQSRLVAERWSAAGARTRSEIVPGANHFTVPAQLTDAESQMVGALAELAERAAGGS